MVNGERYILTRHGRLLQAINDGIVEYYIKLTTCVYGIKGVQYSSGNGFNNVNRYSVSKLLIEVNVRYGKNKILVKALEPRPFAWGHASNAFGIDGTVLACDNASWMRTRIDN